MSFFVVPSSLSAVRAYAGAGNELNPKKAYTSLALFTLLRFPLAFLPSVIINVINALVALNRIGKFLLSSEVQEDDENFIRKGMHIFVALHLRQPTDLSHNESDDGPWQQRNM